MNTPVVAGKKLKKADAYKALASFINDQCKSTWTTDQAKNRYSTYIALYKKIKRESLTTGWGVTEDDKASGIYTVEDKLEKACPFFSELDELFGEKQNINPTSVFDPSIFECPEAPAPGDDPVIAIFDGENYDPEYCNVDTIVVCLLF